MSVELCTPEGNECAGLKKLVKVNGIRTAAGQIMLGNGKLRNYAYYWLGPARKPNEGMFVQFCPCCGGKVGLTEKFLAAFSDSINRED